MSLLVQLKTLMTKLLRVDPKSITSATVADFKDEVNEAKTISEQIQRHGAPLGSFQKGGLYVFEEMVDVFRNGVFPGPSHYGGNAIGNGHMGGDHIGKTVTGTPGDELPPPNKYTYLITSDFYLMEPPVQNQDHMRYSSKASQRKKWVQDAWDLTNQKPIQIDLQSNMMWWGTWYRVNPDTNSTDQIFWFLPYTDKSHFGNPMPGEGLQGVGIETLATPENLEMAKKHYSEHKVTMEAWRTQDKKGIVSANSATREDVTAYTLWMGK